MGLTSLGRPADKFPYIQHVRFTTRQWSVADNIFSFQQRVLNINNPRFVLQREDIVLAHSKKALTNDSSNCFRQLRLLHVHNWPTKSFIIYRRDCYFLWFWQYLRASSIKKNLQCRFYAWHKVSFISHVLNSKVFCTCMMLVAIINKGKVRKKEYSV